MDQFRIGCASQCAQHGIAVIAITDTSPHLDQLVVMQGPAEFGDDGLGHAALPNQHDWPKRMSQPSQVFSLTVAERHALIIGPQSMIRT